MSKNSLYIWNRKAFPRIVELIENETERQHFETREQSTEWARLLYCHAPGSVNGEFSRRIANIITTDPNAQVTKDLAWKIQDAICIIADSAENFK